MAEARERLEQTLPTLSDPPAFGTELFEVTHVLDRSPSLRRALADPAMPAGRRSELVTDLFGEQVGQATLATLQGLAGSQWARPLDLPDAVEILAVTGVAAGAERDGVLDDLEDELFRFGRIVEGQPRLRASLSDPAAPAEAKSALLRELLGDRGTSATLQLITEAATHPRSRGVARSLEHYSQLAAQRRRRLIAVVRTAVALTESQRARLTDALSAAYGHDIHLNIVLDPDVLGGLSVRVGDELIDGTIAGRLDRVRRRLGAAS